MRHVAPRAGAWIEACCPINDHTLMVVAPRAGAWIEAFGHALRRARPGVAPRAGAWIEARGPAPVVVSLMSLPVRERGLKRVTRLATPSRAMSLPVRERGLKLLACATPRQAWHVAPRAGAWIEADHRQLLTDGTSVAPRAGAWIEAAPAQGMVQIDASLPVRERGLKPALATEPLGHVGRSPCGSVD